MNLLNEVTCGWPRHAIQNLKMMSTTNEGKVSVGAGEQPQAPGDPNLSLLNQGTSDGNAKSSAPAPRGAEAGGVWQSDSSESNGVLDWNHEVDLMINDDITVTDDNDDDEIENNLTDMFTEESEEDRNRRVEQRRQENEKKLKEKKLKDQKKEDEDCLQWWRHFNNYGKRHETPVPKFLVIKDGGMRKFSSEHIMKQTRWIAPVLGVRQRQDLPPMRHIKIKGESCLSVHVEDPVMAQKLLRTVNLGPCKVRIEKDKFKNSVAGVLKDDQFVLNNLREEEVAELLKSQGVIEATRFTRARGTQPTNSYKLIFDKHICPESVDIWQRWYKIKEYVPPPIRCYHCQKYDHSVGSCRYKKDKKPPTCQLCGEIGHEKLVFEQNKIVTEACCKKQPHCVNCKGAHAAGNSKECNTHKQWERVQQLIVWKKMSKTAAKFEVFGAVRSERTDAQVAAASAEQTARIESAKKTAIEEVSITHKTDMEKMTTTLATLVTAVAAISSREEVRTDHQDDNMKKTIENMQREMENQKRDIAQNRNDQAELRKTVQTLENTIQKHEKTIQDLNSENKKLKKEAKDIQKELEATKAENEALKKQLKDQPMDTSSVKNNKRGPTSSPGRSNTRKTHRTLSQQPSTTSTRIPEKTKQHDQQKTQVMKDKTKKGDPGKAPGQQPAIR